MMNSDAIWGLVEAKRAVFFDLSDRVWDTPETNYAEHAAAEAHAAVLDAEGFRVARGMAGMPTAVMGEAGQGGPVIAILGEFDALRASARWRGLPRNGRSLPAATGMAAATTCSARAR